MIMKAIGNAWSRIRASRIYYKFFIAEIDYEQFEEMKNEMKLKYNRIDII